MYYALAALIGALIAAMITVNGELTAWYGVYPASFIIHVVGLALIAIIVLARREKLRPREKLPAWCYLGGLVGVLTTVFNNMAFGHISVSALLALGLVGQSVAAVAIDQWGLMGMPKRPFNRMKLVGLGLALCGVAVMLM